jgi:hypothetical protein
VATWGLSGVFGIRWPEKEEEERLGLVYAPKSVNGPIHFRPNVVHEELKNIISPMSLHLIETTWRRFGEQRARNPGRVVAWSPLAHASYPPRCHQLPRTRWEDLADGLLLLHCGE